MNIEIAEHGRMTESGSSLLRLIQNQDMSLLDLLVRESIQNSLDAAKRDSKYVDVNMQVGDFEPRMLNRHFDSIENGLNKRFSGSKEKYIAVSDKNTNGLTGPVKYEDVKNNNFGNCLKLIYEICKPQQNEGAGGSWGLGKTIYFRVGMGLVIYYSRIFSKGQFHTRLAACLVENENDVNALIPGNDGVKRGIAWWGKNDSKWQAIDRTIPLEDDPEIKEILDVFGIEQYKGAETGTTIIIPYINEDSLLNEVYAINEDQALKPIWAKSIEEYLNVSIQRWYAPRILNSQYKYGAYLRASINNNLIKLSEMRSTFKLIRDLYINACGGEANDESVLNDISENNKGLEIIKLNGVLSDLKSGGGNFSYAKVNRSQLEMEPPMNERSPYQQITNRNIAMDSGNTPIILYTRKPGMIVGYDFDGQWTHNMPKTNPDEFIIGVFVLNSDNSLKDIRDANDVPMTLEEYIRQGEKADHASWTDRNIRGNSPRIVNLVQRSVIRKIRKKFNEVQNDVITKKNSGLSRVLADLLLPPNGFGGSSAPKSIGPQKQKHGPKISKNSVFISNPVYTDSNFKADFTLKMKSKSIILFLQVITDLTKYDSNKWESKEGLGKEFPLSISSMEISTVQPADKKTWKTYESVLYVDNDSSIAQEKGLRVEILKSSKYGVPCEIKINSEYERAELTGKITFSFNDPTIKGAIDVKEENL